jgi:hypothetical protein
MPAPGTTPFQPPLAAQNSGPIRVPPLAPERAAEYARLFEKAGAQNGLLQGPHLGYTTCKHLTIYRRNRQSFMGAIWTSRLCPISCVEPSRY